MCVCVCDREGGREKVKKENTLHDISSSFGRSGLICLNRTAVLCFLVALCYLLNTDVSQIRLFISVVL